MYDYDYYDDDYWCTNGSVFGWHARVAFEKGQPELSVNHRTGESTLATNE